MRRRRVVRTLAAVLVGWAALATVTGRVAAAPLTASEASALLDQLEAVGGQAASAVQPTGDGSTRAVCGTPVLVQALHAAPFQGAPYQRRLAKVLARRPVTQVQALTPSRRFRVHYDISGAAAVAPADLDANGRPDYIDAVMATLDSTWVLQVDQLHFRAPPEDGTAGGGPEYDVYVTDLGRSSYYGLTYPEGSGLTTASYLQIDNNYTDTIYRQTRGLDALHVTVAHEFNHGLQFAYYQGSDCVWWQEASATWMEEVAYPAVDDYFQYLASFLQNPEISLDSTTPQLHIYGAALFAHFLDQRYSRDLVRSIWAELGRRSSGSLAHFDTVLRSQGGMGAATAELGVWDYFTGNRYRTGFFAEGRQYPAAKRIDLQLATSNANLSVQHTGFLDHLGMVYLSLQPGGQQTGGARIQLETLQGHWVARLLMVSADTVEVQPIKGNAAVVPGWRRYTNVVVALTETDLAGVSFPYTFQATYDPALFDPPPSSFALVAPAAGDTVETTTPRFTWHPSFDTGSGLARYELWVGNALALGAIPAADTSAVPPQALTPGPHSWFVRAVDYAGNATSSPVAAFVAVADVYPPTSRLTAPAPLQVVDGARYVVTGTATDRSGSGVDSVYVSVDDGATWQPATASGSAWESWSYTWTAAAVGVHTLRCRAVDRLGNTEVPSAGVTVTVRSRVLGDFTDDGVVDFSDFFQFADAFGSVAPRFDLDGSGGPVDLSDFFVFADCFSGSNRARLLLLARERLGLPVVSRLKPTYPNPFNSSTTITGELAAPSSVRLRIYSARGQLLRTLVDGQTVVGTFQVTWDGRDNRGQTVGTGVYLCELRVGTWRATQRLALLR